MARHEPIQLREELTQGFDLSQPFCFETTVRKPSHYPTSLEQFGDETYSFVATVGENSVGCRAAVRSGDTVELTLFVDPSNPPTDPRGVIVELARRLGFFVDVSGFDEVWNADAKLSQLPSKMAGGRPSAFSSLYGFLMICTFLQNTQVRRTVQMTSAMIERFSRYYRFPDGSVLPGLWTASDILGSSEDELRALKLGYRARTVRRLSEQFSLHPLLESTLMAIGDPRELDASLRKIYGIGPATSGYLVFEWFKHGDYLTHVSPWERQILSRLVMDEPDCDAGLLIEECRKRWAPYTMLAVHAVFESVFWKRAEGEGPAWLDPLVRL